MGVKPTAINTEHACGYVGGGGQAVVLRALALDRVLRLEEMMCLGAYKNFDDNGSAIGSGWQTCTRRRLLR